MELFTTGGGTFAVPRYLSAHESFVKHNNNIIIASRPRVVQKQLSYAAVVIVIVITHNGDQATHRCINIACTVRRALVSRRALAARSTIIIWANQTVRAQRMTCDTTEHSSPFSSLGHGSCPRRRVQHLCTPIGSPAVRADVYSLHWPRNRECTL